MLMRDEDVSPLPFQDLELTMIMITNAILNAEEDGTPMEKIERLRRYSVITQQMIEQSQPPPPPAPTMAPESAGAGIPLAAQPPIQGITQ